MRAGFARATAPSCTAGLPALCAHFIATSIQAENAGDWPSRRWGFRTPEVVHRPQLGVGVIVDRRMPLSTVRVPEPLEPLFERAQDYVKRYFAEQAASPETGTLEVCGQRYVLVRAASMAAEFHEMVRSHFSEDEEAVSVVQALLFDVAHAMGLADARSFATRMGVTDPIARL